MDAIKTLTRKEIIMEFWEEHLHSRKKYANVPTDVLNYACGFAFANEYADNLRIAEKGNIKSMLAYENDKLLGCCGFSDYNMIPFLVDGKEWYFGFNYGH